MHTKKHCQSFEGPDIDYDLSKGKLLKKLKRRRRLKLKAETEQKKLGKNVKDYLEKSPSNLFNKQL